MRTQFNELKARQASEVRRAHSVALIAQQATSDRAVLFGAAPGSTGPHSRFARSGAPAESPFTLPARPRPGAAPTTGDLRTDFALREDDFIKSTGGMLDQYIAQGQAVLMNLGCARRALLGSSAGTNETRSRARNGACARQQSRSGCRARRSGPSVLVVAADGQLHRAASQGRSGRARSRRALHARGLLLHPEVVRRSLTRFTRSRSPYSDARSRSARERRATSRSCRSAYRWPAAGL